MTVHIHRVPTRVVSCSPHGRRRWCFICRKRVPFTLTIHTPTDRMSYYGPHATIACECGHVDGDMFPGSMRTWGDD